MFSRALTLLALAASSLAINIQGPSSSVYWVQNVSNVITWTYDATDPNPIDVIVTNVDQETLNGEFSIERNVDLTNGTFVVSHVTLVASGGYIVSFVNGTDHSDVYASSEQFEVMPGGTPFPAETTSAGSSTGGSSSASASGSEATGSSNAGNKIKEITPFPFMAATGILALSGLVALF